MRRRKFIQHAAWFTGGFILAGSLPASANTGQGKKIKGKVTAKGKGIKGVVVSDGYNVVVTSNNGSYEFEPHPEATSVFLSTPAGYAFIEQNGIARHYYLLKDADLAKSMNFNLTRLDKNDNEHSFIIWADPQVKNAKDVEKMMSESVPDVQKWVNAAGTGALLHGITVGDIVWDELQLFLTKYGSDQRLYNKEISVTLKKI